jgi:Transposase
VADAAWLAELLEHGLLRASFVPPPAVRQLRDLCRYRKKLVQAHTAQCQRIHKTLEDAGIKLGSVAADVLGVSGRAMLAGLVAGERDPVVLPRAGQGQAPQAGCPSCGGRCAAASRSITRCWWGCRFPTRSIWSAPSPAWMTASTR